MDFSKSLCEIPNFGSRSKAHLNASRIIICDENAEDIFQKMVNKQEDKNQLMLKRQY